MSHDSPRVTEAEFLAFRDAVGLFNSTADLFSERKLRLFAAQACRRFIWRFIRDRECKQAVEVSLRYAEGLASKTELTKAYTAANQMNKRRDTTLDSTENEIREWTATKAVLNVATLAGADKVGRRKCPYQSNAWDCAWCLNRIGVRDKRIMDLLRHIVGNPFRPYPKPKAWPATVREIATAVHNGQDCDFALHDALLEAGHPGLAEHFKEKQWHPKGCWVLDLILGKE